MTVENALPGLKSATPFDVQLAFDPERDGFSFANKFVWKPADLRLLERRLRPATALALGAVGAIGGAAGAALFGAIAGGAAVAGLSATGAGDGLVSAVARRWPTFGLCGGMSLTAVRRWRSKGRVRTWELQRDPIRALLRRQQEETLRASLPTFLKYWLRVRFDPRAFPDAPFEADLRNELDAIGRQLESGSPGVLGLVGNAPDPFSQHQVVVFGMERAGPLDALLSVYDPNSPGAKRYIYTEAAPEPGRTRLRTDMGTGPRKGGGMHVSTQAGHLSHVFLIPGLH